MLGQRRLGSKSEGLSGGDGWERKWGIETNGESKSERLMRRVRVSEKARTNG